MRVLRIIPSMNPASGGPCQGIRNIIPELEKAGVTNEVVCLDDPGEAFLGRDSFKIYPLGPTKTPWQYSSKLVPWLDENIRKYDLVILHALWLYHGYALRKVVKRLKKAGLNVPKIYVMPHGMLDPYFQQAGERKLKAARNWVYWKLIESQVVNEADGVLFTCESELILARQPFQPYHPKKEINIGYGVQPPPTQQADMVRVFKAKCPGLENQSYFLFLSRIHEKKGIDHLIDAYSKLLEKYSGDYADPLPKLVIAGPGLDTAYGKHIQAMTTASAALRKSVFFPGMLLGNEKWGAFYGCTAFILPSHQENFGIAVAEALSCGKPVLISYQVNIWREIVEHGAGIAADDSSAGAELLMDAWLKLSPVSKTGMQEKAIRCFYEDFAISTAAARFCKLLLNESKAAI